MIARCVALALAVFAAGCDGPVAPGPLTPGPVVPSSRDLSGTWDASFVGKVEDPVSIQGQQENDTFVMELRQEGDSLSGSFAHYDLVVPIVLSGSVNGRVASVVGVLANETCRLTITAELMIAQDGRTVSGPQTHIGRDSGATPNPDCQFTIAGTVSAVKR